MRARGARAAWAPLAPVLHGTTPSAPTSSSHPFPKSSLWRWVTGEEYSLPGFMVAGPTAPPPLGWLQDASNDARFSENVYVKGEPGIRFYAGAPLLGSDGARYGTLCVVDFKPRSFPAGLYNTLLNFAELAVRELERDKVRGWQRLMAVAGARAGEQFNCVAALVRRCKRWSCRRSRRAPACCARRRRCASP